jgi:hypothetical protein
MSQYHRNQKFTDLKIVPNWRNVSTGIKCLHAMCDRNGLQYSDISRSVLLSYYAEENYKQAIHAIMADMAEVISRKASSSIAPIDKRLDFIDEMKYDFMVAWSPEEYPEEESDMQSDTAAS